jgi:hypothetical protein
MDKKIKREEAEKLTLITYLPQKLGQIGQHKKTKCPILLTHSFRRLG